MNRGGVGVWEIWGWVGVVSWYVVCVHDVGCVCWLKCRLQLVWQYFVFSSLSEQIDRVLSAAVFIGRCYPSACFGESSSLEQTHRPIRQSESLFWGKRVDWTRVWFQDQPSDRIMWRGERSLWDSLSTNMKNTSFESIFSKLSRMVCYFFSNFCFGRGLWSLMKISETRMNLLTNSFLVFSLCFLIDSQLNCGFLYLLNHRLQSSFFIFQFFPPVAGDCGGSGVCAASCFHNCDVYFMSQSINAASSLIDGSYFWPPTVWFDRDSSFFSFSFFVSVLSFLLPVLMRITFLLYIGSHSSPFLISFFLFYRNFTSLLQSWALYTYVFFKRER